MPAETKPTLFLLWPLSRLNVPPGVRLPEGYALRTYQRGDETAWRTIQNSAEPVRPGVDLDTLLERYLSFVLPNGLFFAIHLVSGEAVATAGALHNTRDGMFPFGGELGWVATMPTHQSKGLGSAVSAAATHRLIGAGYESIRVGTQDHRLAAIKVYLRLGFRPYVYAADMVERWRQICATLNWPFSPEESVVPAHSGRGSLCSEDFAPRR
jgi:mycothiol synthase